MKSKKYMHIFSTLIILLALSSIISAANAEGETINEVINYSLKDKKIFRNFIETPTLETLEKIPNDIIISKYTNSTKVTKHFDRATFSLEEIYYVDYETLSNGEIYNGTYKSGYMRIGGLSISTEFIDYMGNYENIQQLLLDNNKEGRVTNCIIIYTGWYRTFKIPPIAWVQTDIEDYFIKIEANEEDSPGHYLVYTVQNYAEFKEQFRLKDGTLKINGRDITGDNYVKFENQGIHLPFRTIMEEIGAKITWVGGEELEILIEGNEKIYSLKLAHKISNGTPMIHDGERFLSPVVWLYFGYYEMINGRLILDNDVMGGFTYLFDHKIEIDYENLTVNIIPWDYGSVK